MRASLETWAGTVEGPSDWESQLVPGWLALSESERNRRFTELRENLRQLKNCLPAAHKRPAEWTASEREVTSHAAELIAALRLHFSKERHRAVWSERSWNLQSAARHLSEAIEAAAAAAAAEQCPREAAGGRGHDGSAHLPPPRMSPPPVVRVLVVHIHSVGWTPEPQFGGECGAGRSGTATSPPAGVSDATALLATLGNLTGRTSIHSIDIATPNAGFGGAAEGVATKAGEAVAAAASFIQAGGVHVVIDVEGDGVCARAAAEVCAAAWACGAEILLLAGEGCGGGDGGLCASVRAAVGGELVAALAKHYHPLCGRRTVVEALCSPDLAHFARKQLEELVRSREAEAAAAEGGNVQLEAGGYASVGVRRAVERARRSRPSTRSEPGPSTEPLWADTRLMTIYIRALTQLVRARHLTAEQPGMREMLGCAPMNPVRLEDREGATAQLQCIGQ